MCQLCRALWHRSSRLVFPVFFQSPPAGFLLFPLTTAPSFLSFRPNRETYKNMKTQAWQTKAEKVKRTLKTREQTHDETESNWWSLICCPSSSLRIFSSSFLFPLLLLASPLLLSQKFVKRGATRYSPLFYGASHVHHMHQLSCHRKRIFFAFVDHRFFRLFKGPVVLWTWTQAQTKLL